MPGDLIDGGAIFAPLLAECRRIGLAVSGGPDSLALLLLAHQHGGRTGTLDRFVVYSVDHGLRPEAAGEVAFVVAIAERLGIEARPLRWTARKPAAGVQQAARRARDRKPRVADDFGFSATSCCASFSASFTCPFASISDTRLSKVMELCSSLNVATRPSRTASTSAAE